MNPNSNRDMLDLLLAGTKKTKYQRTETGEVVQYDDPDSEAVYYMTKQINSHNFSTFVFNLKQLEACQYMCYAHMSKERARVVEEQIKRLIDSFRRSIESKSSESLMADGRSRNNTLIDIMSRTKEEKIVNLEGEMKKSFLTGLFGNEENN